MAKVGVARGRGLQPIGVTAEILIDYQLPVAGVMNTKAQVLIIEQRLRRIDPQAVGGSRVLVIEGRLGDVTRLHICVTVG